MLVAGNQTKTIDDLQAIAIMIERAIVEAPAFVSSDRAQEDDTNDAITGAVVTADVGVWKMRAEWTLSSSGQLPNDR